MTVRTQRSGDVGTVVLDRPRTRNALTVELAKALAAAVEELAACTRVIVLRGSGPDFCAGGDVGELARLHAEGRAVELFAAFRRACAVLGSVAVPVVAAVHGHAVAGGFELVQSCDLAVVSADARIADIHCRYGQVPGGGSTQRLPRIVGRQRAMGLILTGETISGRQAVEWGLAYRVAEPGELDAVVGEVVERLLANPAPAMARAKYLVGHALAHTLDDGLDLETRHVLDHLATEAEMALAAFTQRRRTP
ncbi:2-(1,2-epoxy-1,2-dihydrophenyl)acetyl-CoA isomerase [Pseudonocardia thermophila]|uniref:2-(1,2-epoxy-1,2-dihydrophenyl)acetyl-CoA isomerase n=1 Tax=Pseudonocardia thermophila TaxID=1848 RepID=A0A1M6Y1K3_PSETH|nr:enoyl-CoA hydratase/isomerase family protein [Pseudonocardia thermophila]SHL12029.1 2-(1,2-epoxy-1,2-dihydrophenyl)acetyl-CoA isomerase [Pseudonocardia thermophila]